MKYDIIIVGSGIGGLLSAFEICRKSKHQVLLITDESRRALGGRIHDELYPKTNVTMHVGAGIILPHHVHWKKWCKSVGIPWKVGKLSQVLTPDYSLFETLKRDATAMLRTLEQAPSFPDETFYTFALRVLGTDKARCFFNINGYNDYFHADVQTSLKEYHFQDNWATKYIQISWQTILNTLFAALDNCETFQLLDDTTVTKVRPYEREWRVKAGNQSFKASQVILGVPLPSLMNVLPESLRSIYRHIRSQPFMRIFAQLDMSTPDAAAFKTFFNQHSFACKRLGRLFPISSEKGIYCIYYNAGDIAVKDWAMRDQLDIEALLREATGFDVSFKSKHTYYWSVGTHYRSSDSQSWERALERRPAPGLFVVGEAVSSVQGWTEGAVETVSDLF